MEPRRILKRLIALFALATALVSAGALELPRIKAKAGTSAAGTFENSETSALFVPHGYNYIKLTMLGSCTNPAQIQHTTFHPGIYDPAAASNFLARMRTDGYNVVRVFINPASDNCLAGTYGIAGPVASSGLYAPYVSNFTDFLLKARSQGIYVIPVINEHPQNSGYGEIAYTDIRPNIEGYANWYLQPGFVQAKAAYAAALVQAVKNVNAGKLLSTIFAWELQNEIYVFRSQKPYSMTSGMISPANGVNYYMNDPFDRQQSFDANVVRWANTAASAIRAIDPDAMVSTGVFTFAAIDKIGPDGLQPPVPLFDPGRLNDREPARPAALRAYSTLSYTDIHMYNTSPGYDMLADLNSSEFSSMNLPAKPFLMGEFGAFKFRFPSLANAAYAMGAFRDQAYSYGFSGSLFWTWDTTEQPELWHGSEGGGAINDVLAIPKY